MHFQRTIAKGPLRLPLLPFLIFKTVILLVFAAGSLFLIGLMLHFDYNSSVKKREMQKKTVNEPNYKL